MWLRFMMASPFKLRIGLLEPSRAETARALTQQARRNRAARLSRVSALQSAESSVRNSRTYLTGMLFFDSSIVSGRLPAVKRAVGSTRYVRFR